MDERLKKRNKLAEEVLRLSRNTLLVNLRFMDAALHQLQLLPMDGITFATEGNWLLYDPSHVLRCYKDAREIPVRDYLHVILHCVFRHMYIHSLADQVCWDLACDIAVEYTITELGLRATSASKERKQRVEYDRLRKIVGRMTAEKLYRYFLDADLSEARLTELKGLFFADDHRLWYMSDVQRSAIGVPRSGVDSSNDESEDDADETAPGTAFWGEARWAELSNRIQMELESFAKQQGNRAGNLMQNLREVNRERYDYTAFLKKFAVRGEVMQLDPAEFDYIYYTYGLSLYGNLPLIEPLEYREDLRIRSFVIAVDTSGSISEELVHAFLQKTFNILKASESFFSRVDIRILQCDMQIQDELRVTSQMDLDAALEKLTLKGFGGTDFRPVFEYIDRQIRSGELQQLKGLLYFTDGCGIYPQRKPDYDTAFVFLENEGNQYAVPPWAIRLTLEPEEILEDA